MITVVMTTYFSEEVPQRADYAIASLGSLIQYLKAEEGIRLHIADDSEGLEDAREVLQYLANNTGWPGTTYSNSKHNGIGTSLNLAMQSVDDLWMYTTDDWVLQAELNLDGPVKLLKQQGYQLVRLGPVHPDLQCVTRFNQSIGWWLDLQPQYGGFAFATRPFLATKEFYARVGPFDEMLNSYETERLYAERVARSNSKLAYWGAVDLAGPWEHIGIESVGCLNI